MGLLTNLILSFVHLFLVATDILFLLLLSRMLSYRWQTRWLTALNSTGKPVVDWFASHVQKTLGHLTSKALSEIAILIVGLLALTLVRLFLMVLFS